MEVVLFDSWNLNKQDKQIEFLRQAVSSWGKIVPLEQFHETLGHHFRGICSFCG